MPNKPSPDGLSDVSTHHLPHTQSKNNGSQAPIAGDADVTLCCTGLMSGLGFFGLMPSTRFIQKKLRVEKRKEASQAV